MTRESPKQFHLVQASKWMAGCHQKFSDNSISVHKACGVVLGAVTALSFQFGLVMPSIAEIGMVSVFITSLPVASFPSHIFSMVRSIIYKCRKKNRLIEHHVAFCS